MTVADLIAALAGLPSDMTVLIGRDEDLIDISTIRTLPVLINVGVPHDRMDFPDAPTEGVTTAAEIA